MERYLKLETIGRGSYAKVRKVRLASTGEIFAMKVVKKSLLKRRRQWSASEGRYKNAYDDVLREIALMKKLNHPNVIRMHEVVDDPEKDKLCIVLDFHSNGALMDTSSLPDEPIAPLSPADARRFFADVVEGLSYLHFQSVVHLDLKPDNVLVSSDRRGIIADFGVSRLLSDVDRSAAEASQNDVLTSGSPGTPMYCAPEVWGEAKYFAKLADVWSLGVTLFVMLAGYTPFGNVSSHEELVAEVCRPEPVRVPPEVHRDEPGLRELLEGMLAKDPARRISLAEVAAHPWVELAKPREPGLRRQYSRITVNADEIRAAVTIAGHADSFARDSAGRIVKRTRAAERDCYETITRLGSALGDFVPPYHGELNNVAAVAALYVSSPAARLSRLSAAPDSLQSAPRPAPVARGPDGAAASARLPLPPARLERASSSASSALGQPPPQTQRASEAEAEAEGGGGREGRDGRDVCIVLDDVTEGMAEACLMDVKMGTRTFTDSDISDTTARPDLLAKMASLDREAPSAEEAALGAVTKLRYLKFRESLTTTQSLGFRIDAMRIGDDPNLNDTPLNFRRGPTEPAAVLRELTRFLCDSRQTAAAFAARLRSLRAALESDAAFFPRHSLIRSSLLFTYDRGSAEAQPAQPAPPGTPGVALQRVGVHMIDFSSSAQARAGERLTHREPWVPGSGEDGYLVGVDNLIRMFDKIERGELGWGGTEPS